MATRPRKSVATVGALVRREREARGWTLADLTERTGIAEANLSRLERGLSDARVSTLQRVADALGTEVTLARAMPRRALDEVVREAASARERILAAGLGESDPEARLTRREQFGEDTQVEAEALHPAGRRPRL